ncbi:MAG: (2Fe-2S) ferredoxin domain-containing protein [Oscillospiraceae bacterium]
MKITVCIGSSCHLKGSRQVVEQLQALIAQHNLKDQVDLGGTFCMGQCQSGVNVTLDGAPFSLSPETVTAFFEDEVLTHIKMTDPSPHHETHHVAKW